jgi:hypothetical protein
MSRNQNKKMVGILPFLLISTVVIMIATIISTISPENQRKKSSNQSGNENNLSTVLDYDKQILAVLKEIDKEVGTMTLYDIESGQDITLKFTGGTNILDKYEQVIAVSQLSLGEMVDAYYLKEKEKLVKLKISSETWEYKNVNNWILDRTKRTIDVLNSKYKYSKNVYLVRHGKDLDLLNLDEKDEITIKGFEKEIYSITVTKGHGSLVFEDYYDFMGGTAYIGSKAILPVIEDMELKVQEGTYDILFEEGNFIGSKKIEVKPDETVVVNMGEFKKPAVQKGLVKFYISPEGADLYIDDELVAYDTALELEYGAHKIKVSLGGFTPYSSTLAIEKPSNTITIDLVESDDSNNVVDNGNTNSNNSNNNGNNTDANNPNNNGSNTDANNPNNNGDNTNTNTDNNSNVDNNSNNNNNVDTGNNSSVVDLVKNIYILKPEGASVYIGGKFKGTAPVSFPKEVGTQYITLIQEGYETKTYTVEIADDGENVNFSFPEMSKSE